MSKLHLLHRPGGIGACRTTGVLATVREGVDLLRLAGPLIMSALLNMGIAITDVVMMSWLGPVALGAGAVVSDYQSIIFYFTGGILAAAAPIVAHARGSGDPRTVRRTVQHALWLALVLAAVGWIAIWFSPVVLRLLGVHNDIIAAGAPYARMMAFAYVPMLLAMVWRHLLSAHDRTDVIFWLTAIALPVNAVGNYVLMFGELGLPAWGLAGAGLSSFLVTLFLLVASLVYVQRHPVLGRYRLFKCFPRPDASRIRELLQLGLPIGFSTLGETGVFLLATVVMGILGPEVLAAHAVALRTAGVVYAFPLGLSQAATIRVGFASGARDHARLTRVASASFLLALIIGAVYLLVLVLWRADIAAIFLTADTAPGVFSMATLFLVVLAVSQPFDCAGTVGAGILRGVRETRAAMHASLIAYWVFAILVAMQLGLVLDWGGLGIWIGLAVGSVLFGTAIAYQLHRARSSGLLPLNAALLNIAR